MTTESIIPVIGLVLYVALLQIGKLCGLSDCVANILALVVSLAITVSAVLYIFRDKTEEG